VTPYVSELLDGQHVGTGFPDPSAEVLITRYISGWLMLVSLSGRYLKDYDPHLERLEGLDEVWAFCVREPAPGWRIFGRFAAKGLFVGLRAHDRIGLNGRANYKATAIAAIGDWPTVVGQVDPHRAGDIPSYVDGVWHDAEKPF
jgi:hypothetical protein